MRSMLYVVGLLVGIGCSFSFVTCCQNKYPLNVTVMLVTMSLTPLGVAVMHTPGWRTLLSSMQWHLSSASKCHNVMKPTMPACLPACLLS
jgi:hypothetical protein